MIFGEVIAADAACAFTVLWGGQLLLDTGWDAYWTPASQGELALSLPATTAALTVYGQVRTASGVAEPDLVVRLFRVLIDSEVEVTSQTAPVTNGAGRYEAGPVSPNDLVVVRAYRLEANAETLVATSATRLGAGRVDLVTSADGRLRGASEYARVVAAVDALRGQITIQALTEENVAYLAARSGIDPAALSTLVRAARLAHWPQSSATWLNADVSLQTDFVYALIRQRHGQTLEELLAGRPLFSGSWDAAVAQNIVEARDITDDLAAVDALVARRIEQTSALAPALAAGTLSATDVATIRAAYATHTGTIAQFWSSLSLAGATKVAAQDGLRLDIITDGHAPLIEDLLGDRSPSGLASWQTTRDLAAWSASTWSSRLAANTALIPSDLLPSGTPGERAAEYAKQIRRRLSQAYPTVLVTADLARVDGSFTALAEFARDHADYEMSIKPLRTFQTAQANALLAVAEPIERLFRLVGEPDRSENLAALRTAGYGTGGSPGSAYEVVRRGRTAFLNDVSSLDESVASRIFDRALQINAVTTTTVMRYGKALSTGTGYLAPAPLPSTLPDWATIFGSLDSCSCKDCQSVLSPAAYLVDVLRFLRDVPGGATPTAWTVLNTRRPDISALPLTCANTNTVLPHIDLVNELLERKITGATTPLDTTWPPNELAIHPENLDAGAYEALAEKIFPLWTRCART